MPPSSLYSFGSGGTGLGAHLGPGYHEWRAEWTPFARLSERTAAFAVAGYTNEEFETVSRSGGLQ